MNTAPAPYFRHGLIIRSWAVASTRVSTTRDRMSSMKRRGRPGRRPKRQTMQQKHDQHRHFQEASSPTIREAFPAVKSIEIRLTFEDFDQLTPEIEPRSFRFNPDRKAFFEFKCSMRECVAGGFDLNGAVREAIRSHETTVTGNETCEGWQDEERIGQHRCLLKANYEIQAEY